MVMSLSGISTISRAYPCVFLLVFFCEDVPLALDCVPLGMVRARMLSTLSPVLAASSSAFRRASSSLFF